MFLVLTVEVSTAKMSFQVLDLILGNLCMNIVLCKPHNNPTIKYIILILCSFDGMQN